MSNVVEFEARTSVERQAREWLIRMDGDEPLSEAEIQALREWTRRSVLHREELQRICKFWRRANVLAELAVCLESATQGRRNNRGRWVAGVALAASAVFAAVVIGWWYLQRLDGRFNGSYQTLVGQQKSITLSDGSSIQMNTDSQVQVVYDSDSRAIRLLKGEALFSVMPDRNRPFEVYVADSVVRAVGTAFAVHLDGSKVDVTVTKGVVDVAEVSHALTSDAPTLPRHKAPKDGPSSGSLERLKAGEMIRVGSGADHIEVQQLAEAELQRKMAWQEGYLAFSGEPLSEVVEQVNRYSPTTLELGDPKLASVAIGGRFRIGDLDAVLDVLETNFGIQAHRIDEHTIRLESEHLAR
jgi:transmembrane sensor